MAGLQSSFLTSFHGSVFLFFPVRVLPKAQSPFSHSTYYFPPYLGGHIDSFRFLQVDFFFGVLASYIFRKPIWNQEWTQ